MVAAQEGIPDDARISDKRYHGARVSVSGARCGDQGRARLARVVQLHQSRGRHGVHGRGGRESQVLADMGDTQAEEEERRPGGTRFDGIWNPLFAVNDAPPPRVGTPDSAVTRGYYTAPEVLGSILYCVQYAVM